MARALRAYALLLFLFTAGGILSVSFLEPRHDEDYYRALAFLSIFGGPVLFGFIRRSFVDAWKAFGIGALMNGFLWAMAATCWLGMWG